ncbi:hypothetical protein [Nocardia sp. NPDC046763]|uniref:hypothetical protein n=1 Tax=Nocardia sp. NPDC046763 TaxID=3155256 RepID=UPI0033E1D80D
MIVVGSAFDGLSWAGREGALASALAVLDLLKAGRRTFQTAVVVIPLLMTLLLMFIQMHYGISPLQSIPLATISALTYLLGACGVWSRVIIYRMDRRVTQVMGRPVIDGIFEGDRRDRTQSRGVRRAVLVMFSPSVSRRVKRLNASAPSDAAPHQ